MRKYRIPSERKKILLISDDIRFQSGVATMMREIVVGTSGWYDWVALSGAISHPDEGKRLDLNADTNKLNEITDASVTLYPITGYGTPDLVRQMIKMEKPDALFIVTDPRYFIWLFQIENEIRKHMPIIYYNIWDNLPYPHYNKSFYESCDGLLAISKQTENINRVVLDDKAKDKIIKYVPHGINEKVFFPIREEMGEYLALKEFKKRLFNNSEYDFVLLYNARNLRRKSTPDLIEAYVNFIDQLSEEKAKKCIFVLHTQVRDEAGTDLEAVTRILTKDNPKYNIIFDESRYSPQEMNLLYNACDCTALISSNEGWGLSLTESMMCGRPIIANATGGMIDQLGFLDDEGNIIKYDEKFGSNHRGKYKDHIKGTYPVFPSNLSMMGSLVTPYIYDDRCNAIDVATQIYNVWDIKQHNKKEYQEQCEFVREWVTSDESMMSARKMCENIMNGVDETLDKFKPKNKFELILC